ncbi:MAG: synthase subunit [Hyphomicrobiales bacterium]|nr:synthase subunit [Hyphomicrobiales bacterium]
MFITEAVAATAAQDHAAGAAGHSAVFPPFDVSTFASQIVWLAIAFGLLYFVMARVALPRVAGILEKRSGLIAGDLETAAAAQKQANDAGLAYEKTLGDARANAQKTVQQLRDALTAETETKRKALEADLNGKLATAEATIAATKADAMTNVTAIASDAASAIVRQITGRDADPKVVAAAVAAVNG